MLKTEFQTHSTTSNSVFSYWSVQLAGLISVVLLILISRVSFAEYANLKPVASLALFGGFLFARRYLTVVAVIAGMFIADCFLGGYSWPLAILVYACLVAPVFMGRWMAGKQDAGRGAMLGNFARWLICVVGGSILFFAVTNFAFWKFMPIYSQDMHGLIECYVNALPFFRNTLLSDFAFAGLLFGSYVLLKQISWQPRPLAALAPKAR